MSRFLATGRRDLMRTELRHFTKAEKKSARERWRLISEDSVEKTLHKPIYWTLPFLLRMWSKTDEYAQSNLEFALRLAKCSVAIAKNIRVAPTSEFYQCDRERRDFVMVSTAIHASVLSVTGRAAEAKMLTGEALGMASKNDADPLARAEVLRRAAVVSIELGEAGRVQGLASRAAQIFEEKKVYDSLALCHIHLGRAERMLQHHAEAAEHYCQALYWGAKQNTNRGHRAVLAAANNLVYCALLAPSGISFPSHFIEEWASAAQKALKGTKASLPKCKVGWVLGLAEYRSGLGRRAISRLIRVRNQLLGLDAFGEAASCTADLISVVIKYEPDALERVVEESVKLLSEATPAELRPLVEKWIGYPSDVALLRQIAISSRSTSTRSD